MRITTMGVVLAAMVALGWSAPVGATPVSGPRETVDLTFSSVLPKSPTGYRYREVYRDPSHPGAAPPPVRAITFTGPAGGRVDSGAAPQCTASDGQLKSQGERACPPGSRTGHGTTTVAMGVLGRMTGAIGLFNGPGQEVDVISFGGHVGAIVRDIYTANGFSNLVPTCLTGGQPPDGCPTDEVSVVSTDQSAPAITSGTGRNARSLMTNPPSCPASGRWTSHLAFRFTDGTVDRLTAHHPCTRPRLAVRRRRCALRATLTGRDLHEVSSVEFLLDGRRVARDRRAPFRLRRRLARGHRHRVGALVHAHGVTVARMHRTVRRCG